MSAKAKFYIDSPCSNRKSASLPTFWSPAEDAEEEMRIWEIFGVRNKSK